MLSYIYIYIYYVIKYIMHYIHYNIIYVLYCIILYSATSPVQLSTWERLVYNMVFRLLLTKFLSTKEKLKFF